MGDDWPGRELTPLGQLLVERLAVMQMRPAEAARRIHMHKATFSALLNSTRTRSVEPAIRAKLEDLGLGHAEIEYVAAITAGYDLTPPGISPTEWARVLRMRDLDAEDVANIDRRIDRLLDEEQD